MIRALTLALGVLLALPAVADGPADRPPRWQEPYPTYPPPIAAPPRVWRYDAPPPVVVWPPPPVYMVPAPPPVVLDCNPVGWHRHNCNPAYVPYVPPYGRW